MVHRPAWFRDDYVFVTYAETFGINKDGETLYVVDSESGKRTETIDDRVSADVAELLAETSPLSSETARWVPKDKFGVAVPAYYDARFSQGLRSLLGLAEFAGFEPRSLGSLVRSGELSVRGGHGSPPADMRQGEVPYIKVSDIRAGQVNINPSNMVPRVVAQRFWRGGESGVLPFDLITPIRASKNIGEFALLMPGQEEVVFTKEVLIVRPGENAIVDNFYLMWALTLTAVRDQWKRIVFMQTNRDDVGERYLEVEIPWPATREAGAAASQAFRDYYTGLVELRSRFVGTLESSGRHFVFLGRDNSAPLEEEPIPRRIGT